MTRKFFCQTHSKQSNCIFFAENENIAKKLDILVLLFASFTQGFNFIDSLTKPVERSDAVSFNHYNSPGRVPPIYKFFSLIFQMQKSNLDLYEIITNLRKQRPAMVQTKVI